MSPVIKLKIVDFPTPFGPNMPKISPLFMVKPMLSNISLLPKESEIFSNLTSGVFFLKDFILNFFIIAIF
jgi:hypothetical protein